MVRKMLFEEFQDGCRHGHQNGRILAIQNLHIALMSPPTFGLRINII